VVARVARRRNDIVVELVVCERERATVSLYGGREVRDFEVRIARSGQVGSHGFWLVGGARMA
jgi:hypothetical protein